MKASLGVIASLFISPAYAFENLIIESTFQYPVEVTGNAASWSDAQMTAAGTSVQGRNSWAVPGFAAAPNFPAVPNLLLDQTSSFYRIFPPIPNLLPGPNLIAIPNLPGPNLAAIPICRPGPNLIAEPNPCLAHRRQTKALRPKSLAIFPTLS